MNFQELLKQSFYPAAIMIALNIAFLAVAIVFKRRDKVYRVLIIYSMLALIQDFICLFPQLSGLKVPNEPLAKRVDPTVGCFICAEFVLFFAVFYIHFTRPNIRSKIFIAALIFGGISIPITIYMALNRAIVQLRAFEGYLSVCAGFLLLMASLYYYYTLFAEPPVVNIANSSSFWIITGIMFLHAVNIPLFLIENYLHRQFLLSYFSLYSINYIAYSMLFILFIISVFCKEDLAKYQLRLVSKNR